MIATQRHRRSGSVVRRRKLHRRHRLPRRATVLIVPPLSRRNVPQHPPEPHQRHHRRPQPRRPRKPHQRRVNWRSPPLRPKNSVNRLPRQWRLSICPLRWLPSSPSQLSLSRLSRRYPRYPRYQIPGRLISLTFQRFQTSQKHRRSWSSLRRSRYLRYLRYLKSQRFRNNPRSRPSQLSQPNPPNPIHPPCRPRQHRRRTLLNAPDEATAAPVANERRMPTLAVMAQRRHEPVSDASAGVVDQPPEPPLAAAAANTSSHAPDATESRAHVARAPHVAQVADMPSLANAAWRGMRNGKNKPAPAATQARPESARPTTTTQRASVITRLVAAIAYNNRRPKAPRLLRLLGKATCPIFPGPRAAPAGSGPQALPSANFPRSVCGLPDLRDGADGPDWGARRAQQWRHGDLGAGRRHHRRRRRRPCLCGQ